LIHSPGLFLTILAFALVIGPLVFVHEMGHYLAGRLFGVKAEVFSIGFGNELFGVTDKRGTRWKFSWLPLGGYVRFAGDMNAASVPDANWLMLSPEDRARTFPSKPVWQRAIIVAAGPLTNFALAILILAGVALALGDPNGASVAGRIQPGSAAATAGLQAGDRITAFDGHSVATFGDMISYVQPRAGKATRITFVRDDAARTVEATIGAQIVTDTSGKPVKAGLLGINRAQVGIFEAPGIGVRQTGEIVAMMGQAIGQIVVGKRSVKELGGPLSIAKASGEYMAVGADAFVFLIALVSINLGFINLLPVPMLDGGHLFFYAIEAVRRKPVEPQVQEWAFRGGLAALLALMLLVTFNDLDSFGLWNNLAGLIG
jgi:regulator of sigma E protease